MSRFVEKVKYEMKADKGLKKRIQNMAEKFTKSQRQTLSGWVCIHTYSLLEEGK